MPPYAHEVVVMLSWDNTVVGLGGQENVSALIPATMEVLVAVGKIFIPVVRF